MHKYIYIATTTLALGSASLFAGTVEDGYYSEYEDISKNKVPVVASKKEKCKVDVLEIKPQRTSLSYAYDNYHLPNNTIQDANSSKNSSKTSSSLSEAYNNGFFPQEWLYNNDTESKEQRKIITEQTLEKVRVIFLDAFLGAMNETNKVLNQRDKDIDIVDSKKYERLRGVKNRTQSPTGVTSVASSIASSPTQDSNLLNQGLLNINSLKHLDPNAANNLNSNVDDINISSVKEHYSGDRKLSVGDLSGYSTSGSTSSEAASVVDNSKNTKDKMNILISTLETLPEGVDSKSPRFILNSFPPLMRSKSTGQ